MGLFTPQMRHFGAKKKKTAEQAEDAEEVEAVVEAVEDVVEEVAAEPTPAPVS
jgi:archaellum component FlaC